MARGRTKFAAEEQLQSLVADLHHYDCSITNETLERLLSFEQSAVPYLEEILQERLEQGPTINLGIPPTDTKWFVVIHALFLLAHLPAPRALDLVLRFLGQKPEILDYWLQGLAVEELWEVPYLLGRDHLDKLGDFFLNRQNNEFSRLTVCTSLVQLALNFPAEINRVRPIFVEFLAGKDDPSDFVGLVCSELLDLLDLKLKLEILAALDANNVWSELLSAGDVEHCYKQQHHRILQPATLVARYDYFRQHAYFSRSAEDSCPTEAVKRVRDQSSDVA